MIAIDAMGGDFSPQVAVFGAYRAAKKGIPVMLFGQQALIADLLTQCNAQWRQFPIEIVHCTESIGMSEEPSRSIIRKKDASIVRAMEYLAQQKVSAFVSAGHSGAILTAAVLILKRTDGIMRPALSAFIPTPNGPVFCLDLGANTDCKPEYLRQFALMGSLFLQKEKGIAQPRVALLSNGAERFKGSQVVKQAYGLLENAPVHFVGNLEPKELFNGYADVIVTDGFIGNVVLKTVQGSAQAMRQWIVQEFNRSWATKALGFLTKPIFKRLEKTIDYTQYGGALLLGVNGPVIVAHGSSNEVALENAIAYAHHCSKEGTIARFNYALIEQLNEENVSHEVSPVSIIKSSTEVGIEQ